MKIIMSNAEFDSVNGILKALTDGDSNLYEETFEWKTIKKDDKTYEVELPEGYIMSSNISALPYVKILIPNIKGVVETFRGMITSLDEVSSVWQTEWEKKKKEKKEKETKEN